MYKIIDDLPIYINDTEASAKDYKLYKEWFLNNKETRLVILAKAVNSTSGYENWEMNFTPDSLEALDSWWALNVETRKLSSTEYQIAKNSLSRFEIEVDDTELTNRTVSIAIDIGIYLGEIFVRNYPQLNWEQSKKNNVDKGAMVIPLGKTRLNPIFITVNGCYTIMKKGKFDLFDFYNIRLADFVKWGGLKVVSQ